MSYEGWSNYETWNVKLWLDNEEPTYLDVTEEASSRTAGAALDDEEPDAGGFADWLRDYVDELLEGSRPVSGMAADLFGAAWSEIDWREIAQAYLGDAASELERSS